jgi:hypothetical protein
VVKNKGLIEYRKLNSKALIINHLEGLKPSKWCYYHLFNISNGHYVKTKIGYAEPKVEKKQTQSETIVSSA